MNNKGLLAALTACLTAFDVLAVDTTKPVLTVSAPLASTSTTNNNFTANGKATDNVSVANVFYRLNDGGWETADTTNSWLTWTADLTLRPGTNVFSVYGVDTSANLSVTNTVRFFYLVTTPLTVRTNGLGSISPNYNQALLNIGQNYTITAKPAVGFAFTNWTGSVATNKPALVFMMDRGYALTANFVDIAKPTLTVTAPLVTTVTLSNSFTASGKAADNLAVEEVRYKLNDESWQEASTTNGWTNWTANLTLSTGTNVLSVYAEDEAGNDSLTNTVRFIYQVNTTLTVRTNGKGSISPNYNSSLLRIGQNYTLTATPGTGFAFTNWTDAEDDLVTNKPTLLFLMASNLVYQANFVDVSKPVLTVATPLATTSTSNTLYLATGKSTDNAAIAGVYFQLNGGAWLTADSTNGWASWSAILALTPGTNALSVYAEDTSANRSATNTVKFSYSTAPATLNNLRATVTPDDATPFGLAFGASTFSQISADTNNVNGVGNYTFTVKSPSTAQIKFTYTGPPSVTNGLPQTIDLTFSAPGVARFTNTLAADAGDMFFSPSPNWASSSINGKAVVTVTEDGQGMGTYFISGKYVSLDLITRTTNNGSSFGYVAYSREAALFRLNDVRGVTYLVANYLGTNYGVYYSEEYSSAGVFKKSGLGVFGFASQRSGGNAPFNLVNCNLQMYSGNETFGLTFRTNAFGQTSFTTNFPNAVGNYLFSRTDTNRVQLKLIYSAPPTASGVTNLANFTFFADNLAFYTNGDGTISAAVLSSITNRAPNSLAGKSFVITNETDGDVSQFQFASDGTFASSGAVAASGNYVYSTYSGWVGMAQLTFTNVAFAGDTGWLQLNYESSVTGASELSVFDAGEVLQLSEFGNFQQQ